MGMTFSEVFMVAMLFGAFIAGRYSKRVEHYEDLRSKMRFISVDDAEMDQHLRKNAQRSTDQTLSVKERKTAQANLKFDQEIQAYRRLLIEHGWTLRKSEPKAAAQAPAVPSSATVSPDDDDDDICTFPY